MRVIGSDAKMAFSFNSEKAEIFWLFSRERSRIDWSLESYLFDPASISFS
jgi:hypothetical protein